MSEHWVKWDEYSTPQDIAESILEVVNDITRKHNLQLQEYFLQYLKALNIRPI